ncbi:MAG: TonB-dependent receptor domain-containing protein [Woeseiaceae bacterium]
MNSHERLWRTLGWSLVAAGFSMSAPVYSQDDDSAAELQDAAVEEIVVTGSKLRRDEFSSISPVQVIGGQDSVKIGTVDTAAMIAESPFVFGTQLDGSTNSGSTTGAVEGVPASGPGSATVSLRGLGAERTLLLVNGRRLSPSGVRGAPVAPDLNLIPSAMIDRIEILTDGASSIYGADAVAGVANIILRSEFEGIELRGFGTSPEQSGGEESLVSFIGGASNDRSNFTVAAEYFNRDRIMARDRTDWNSCLMGMEVATDGTVYKHCQDSRPDNAAFISSAGFVYYTPGTTDLGIPDWSSADGANLFLGRTDQGTELPGNLTGSASETPYNLQQEELDTQLQGDVQRVNLYATGKYELTPSATIYLEGSYTQRQNEGIFTSEQAFPAIPHMIPQLDINGNIVVEPDDIFWATDQNDPNEFLADGTTPNPMFGMCDPTASPTPVGAGSFPCAGVLMTAAGEPILVDNPLNPFDAERALPVYSLRGLSQERKTDIDNFRVVAGIEGDFGSGWFNDRGWFYDAFISLEENSGTSVQAGILEPHIRESIDTLHVNAAGNLECGLPRTAGGFGFLTPADCVVVDWFAPSLFDVDGSQHVFATQAESEFLFGNVINTTEIKQQHYSALVSGEIFDMPAGPAAMAFGVEYRENSINSANDIIRSQGLSASESTDIEGDTIGSTWIADAYAEIELPVHDTFILNLSGRYTEEKNFGNETTWSAKAQFAPVDWFRIRATAGTTFRAPNLREQFLAGQAGVEAGTSDPCVVPAVAVVGGVYDAASDPRSARVLANCIQDGTDPEALGLQANVLIPTNTGGSDDITAETSDSFTAGFVFSQPWSDAFDLDFGITYFDIEVNDTVEELDPVTILNRCYNDEDNLASPFCSRITRAGVNPENNTIGRVDASFVNLGLVTSTGYDINVRYVDDFQVGNKFWDLQATLTATNYDEQLEQIDNEAPVNNLVGEAGSPEWSWIARVDLNTGNWSVTYRARYIDSFALDTEDLVASTNLSRRDPCRTLGGPADCVDKGFGPSKIYHDLSTTYVRDDWSVSLGIKNLFDNEPPLIAQSSGPARLNYVVQSTYDFYGRRAFLNLQKSF